MWASEKWGRLNNGSVPEIVKCYKCVCVRVRTDVYLVCMKNVWSVFTRFEFINNETMNDEQIVYEYIVCACEIFLFDR